MNLKLIAILMTGGVTLVCAEPALRQQKYSSGSTSQAVTWQKDLRAKLFQTLHMGDLVARKEPIPFATKDRIWHGEDFSI